MSIHKAAAFCGSAILLALSNAASAADKPLFSPPAAWVDVASIPEAPAEADQAQVVLLSDEQVRFEGAGEVSYRRMVVKVVKPEGLSSLANQSFTWRPDSETLTIHTLRILRGGQVIDLHPEEEVTILRRETRLEAAMLDGSLTITKQVAGLQIGDVLDMAISLERVDPVRKGRSESRGGYGFRGVASRARTRYLWPTAEPMTWRKYDGLAEPVVKKAGDMTEVVFDRLAAKSEPLPPGAPTRFARLQSSEVTEFKDWGEISSLMAPLYASTSTITPGSPLAAEAEKIKAASADPKVRAAMALQLVQEKVRYFLLGMGDGGYVPAAAEATWERRFGDCKGKTVLLLALLKEVGVEAEPALVHTIDYDGLEARLPLLGAFNHVLVRATIGGKTYWMDGTRRREAGDLDAVMPLAFRWALPVRTAGAPLERVDRPPYARPTTEAHTTLDFSKGLEAPATITLTGVARDEFALSMQTAVATLSPELFQRAIVQSMTVSLGAVEVKSFDCRMDPDGSFVMTLVGEAPLAWRTDPQTGVVEYRWADSLTAVKVFPSRAAGPLASLPYRLTYPSYSLETGTLIVPGDGKGFKNFGQKANETLAGNEIACEEAADGAKFTFRCTTRALAYEVPAAEAMAADRRIRTLLQDRAVVRKVGEGQ